MDVRLSKWRQVLLTVVCIVIGLAASQEHYLSYDNATGFLHFRCPLDSDLKNNKLIVSTFGRYNQRTTSGQVSRIANWYNNSATKYEDTGNVVLTTRQYGLKGYLTDVRCEDSFTYYCSYHFSESNGRISSRLDNFTFSFEGPLIVSIERPQNVHPCPGDKMEVTCRAFLGRQTNSIVWESRPPDGQFVLDTDSYINYSNPVDTKSCNYYAESRLSRDLTATDNKREWRCRLSYGQAAATFIIIVEVLGSCLNNQSEGNTTTAPPTLNSPQPLNTSGDSPWGKASFLIVALVLLTAAIVFLLLKRNIIQFINPKSESRENIVTDQQTSTTGAHNDQSHTPASNPLEPHPSPIPFDEVVGEDGYAKFSDDGLDHDPRPSDPLDLQDIDWQTPAAASPFVDPGYSGLDDDPPDYNRLVHHGNSDVTLSLASASELDYKHLDISAFLASSLPCESDKNE
ncbi:uncharacterized protein LOC112560381 isoform X1 [Pomacea canaliculata]|uniref:uncharacterized protein LOC112560381 isoform X1 n=1 Tax=Pomacea canaliculata TaxID=400727 RepID=UPI000D728B2F|nr:uncharacterized protein LOC112560381 isoform X1 [Pomacea canaliculata]